MRTANQAVKKGNHDGIGINRRMDIETKKRKIMTI